MEQEQALISKKSINNGFSVNRDLVNSKLYHDKFEKLDYSKKVSEALYHEAGRLLEIVDGKNEEHLIAVDCKSGMTIADNLDRSGKEYRTSFNEDEMAKIKMNNMPVCLLHNHPSSRPPSGTDIVSFIRYSEVDISLIICHDGDVYAILRSEKIVADIYEAKYNEFRKSFDEDSSKVFATKALYDLNVNDRLFTIRRL